MGQDTLATLRSAPMAARPRRLHLPSGGGRPKPVSRRTFLLGAAAATVLTACGDDGGPEVAGEPVDESGGLSVVRFFGPFYAAGVAARVPIGLSDADGILPVDAAPGEVRIDVSDPDGELVAENLVAPLRHEGLPRPYYPFEFTPETDGFYDVAVDTGDGRLTSQIQIVPADDRAASALLQPGEAMPALETPTVGDPQGVDPICTRMPPCDLHDVTVADAIGTGPMVLLVSTPAFCKVAVCGPVLDVMLDLVPDHPGITFVHAEVYKDPENMPSPPTPDDHAPVVEALGLPFEPALFAVGADGIVRERLDYIFDRVEMAGVLDRLS